jgi:hypothetical protein
VCVSINASKSDAIYDIDINQGVDVDSKFWAYKIEVVKSEENNDDEYSYQETQRARLNYKIRNGSED